MLIVTVLIVATGAWIVASRIRVPHGLVPAKLGWMSEQWLAEYRASQVS